MTDGKGCKCHAKHQEECGCDADWTPREVQKQREDEAKHKAMNQFEIMVAKKPKCDICGGVMLAMYGCGWDEDRMICGDVLDCGAEIVFPTSTVVDMEGKPNGIQD